MSAETTSRTIARFTVAVPRQLPTLNSRLHWNARARQVRIVRDTVCLLARSERLRRGIAVNTHESRTLNLTLIRGKGQRELDSDNAVSACKSVRDGLIDAGWLVDDSPAWLSEYTVTQRKDKGADPAVIVEIGVPA